MAKAIYCLKVFIFRDEFVLSNKNNINYVVFKILVAANREKFNWIQTNQSFDLFSYFRKNNVRYATNKFAVLSFFDNTDPIDIKKIVITVKASEDIDSKARRFIINKTNLNSTMQKKLSDSVSKKSLNLFKIIEL